MQSVVMEEDDLLWQPQKISKINNKIFEVCEFMSFFFTILLRFL